MLCKKEYILVFESFQILTNLENLEKSIFQTKQSIALLVCDIPG